MRSCNSCCCLKARSVLYFECVFKDFFYLGLKAHAPYSINYCGLSHFACSFVLLQKLQLYRIELERECACSLLQSLLETFHIL